MSLTNEQLSRIKSSVDSFVEETINDPVKTAAADGVFGTLAKRVGAGAAITAGSLAAVGAYNGVKDLVNKSRKKTHYNAMLASNPALKDLDDESKARAFDTLYRFNPSYAKDPNVSGSFVSQMASMGTIPVDVVNSLVKSNREMNMGQGGPQGGGGGGGADRIANMSSKALTGMLSHDME